MFILFATKNINAQNYTYPSPADDPPQAQPFQLMGESFQTDLFTGSGTASIPIAVPPGTNGMQPALAFVYNSGNRNNNETILSTGWDLQGLGYIERNTKKGVPNYDQKDMPNDTYIMVLGKGAHDLIYVSSDGYYHTKMESHIRIEYISPSNHWLVTDKNGTRYRFGYNSNSNTPAVGRNATRRWSLDLVTDTHGNEMSITYNNDTAKGTTYPLTITYTQGNGLTTFRTVEFYYEVRPTEIDIYRYAAPVTVTKRLAYIDVKMNGAMVRRYELSYTNSTNSKDSLLTKVQEFGADATSERNTGTAFPPNIIEYSVSENGFAVKSITLTTNTSSVTPLVADFDRNGKADVAYCMNNSWRVANTATSGSWGGPDCSVGVASVGDFNADGRADLAVESSSSAVEFYRSSGSAFQYRGSWSAPSATLTNMTGSIKISFADLDGDDQTDILFVINYSNCSPYGHGSAACTIVWAQINKKEGSSFWSEDEWAYWSGSAPNWIRFFDMNGDGRADMVLNDSSGIKVYFSTGTFFTTKGIWSVAAPPLVGLERWRFGDFNGDGLLDLALLDDTVRKITVYINRGNLLKVEKPWLDVPGNWVKSGDNPQVFNGDFNGDGKADFIYYKTGGLWVVQLSTGVSFGTPYPEAPGSGIWLDDATANASFPSHLTFFADFNGDGKTDLGEYDGAISMFPSLGPAVNMTTTIKNSLGGRLTYNYQPSVNAGNTYLPFHFPIVGSMTLDDGMGHLSTTTYSYSGGQYNISEGEFRGFSEVTVTDPTGAYSKTTFLQTDQLKGSPSSVENYQHGGIIHAKRLNNWNHTTPFTGVVFRFLSQEDVYSYDGTSAATFKQAQTKYFYDNYGNVKEIHHLGDINLTPDTDNRYDYVEFVYNVTDWIVSLPNHLYTKDSNSATVSEIWNYYDGAADYTALPTKGELTRTCKWLGPGVAKLCSTSGYDVYGNLTSVTDTNNHKSTVVYDGIYRTFPVMETNALGHSVIKGYDSMGKLTSVTDPNNITSSFQYDALGRKTADIIPPDNAVAPTASYVYTQTGTAPSNTLIRKRQNIGGGTLDSYTFVDGLGRTIQTKTPASDGLNHNVTDKTYNNVGLVHTVSNPYPVPITATYSTPDIMAKKTTTLYDSLRRINQVTNTDNTYSSISYDKWTTSIIDPNGRKKTETRDAFGRLIQIDEYTGADGRSPSIPAATYARYATTKYTYDIFGNLKTTTDELGNVAIINYDTLGRKLSTHDPDMGDWGYRYDPVGNLIQQTDAKGQITYLTYDALNRIKTKTLTATADTQLPSNPSGLTATGFNSKQINLTWTASTDDVAVVGYKVERCQGASCSDFVEVATPTEASYGDGGLTANTTYHYRIRSVDIAGNLSSSYSNIAWAITSQTDSNSPTAPSGLTATAVSATQVNLSWTASTDNVGVDHYEVERFFNNGLYALIATPTSSSYGDNMGGNGTTYLYRVRAVDAAGNTSGYSNIDLATTVPFTDNPLLVGTTTIKAQHLTELRQAVNAVRLTAGLAASVWTDPTLAGLFIQKIHIEELRSNLTPALTALGFTAPTYTDPTLTAGSTVMKKAHVEELRQAVK